MQQPPTEILANVDVLSANLLNLLNSLHDAQDQREIVLRLKGQADLNWGKAPRVSFILANIMIAVGELLSDDYAIALGLMSKGDSYRFLHRIEEAHSTLEKSGELFHSIGNEVGWARTRIGRLLTSYEIGGENIQEAIEDVETARKIFLQHKEFDFLVRLSINLSAFYMWRSEFRNARETLLLGINLVDKMDSIHHARLLHNLGIAEQADGEYTRALEYYKQSEILFSRLDQQYEIVGVKLNLAALWMLQGHYRVALNLMQDIHDQLYPASKITNYRNQITCYQLLGAHDKAQRLSLRILRQADSISMQDQAALHMFRGDSLIELAATEDAIQAYNVAETLLNELETEETLSELVIRRAAAQLKQNNLDMAIRLAKSVVHSDDLYVKVRSNLVLGYAALQLGEFDKAVRVGVGAYRASRELGMASLIYRSLNLLGQIRETGGDFTKALYHYERANKRVLEIHRNLSRDYRPEYLENSQQAFHSIIRIHLQREDFEKALGVIESVKSFIGHQQFYDIHTLGTEQKSDRWLALEAQLKETRAKYLDIINSVDAKHGKEKRQLEQTMMDIVAESRLQVAVHEIEFIPSTLTDIQDSLSASQCLLEFYSDGYNLFAFFAGRNTKLSMKRIELATLTEVLQTTKQLKRSIQRAIVAGNNRKLYLSQTQELLKKLYDVLIAPWHNLIHKHAEIVVVPYGILHSIPFQLLYDGTRYLTERYSVILRPISLQTHNNASATHGISGALALGYNQNDETYRMEKEAQSVTEIVGGKHFVGKRAVSQQLSDSSYQILHLAVHGQHNLHHPRLSYITLEDGPLFLEDIWQFDLKYELVVLSACRVGLSRHSGGDELIGLGSSFLYAGAKSLVSSLWDVDDDVAEAFMKLFYHHLKQGLTKGKAIQQTQLKLMKDKRFEHPAFWGAFQLYGNSSAF